VAGDVRGAHAAAAVEKAGVGGPRRHGGRRGLARGRAVAGHLPRDAHRLEVDPVLVQLHVLRCSGVVAVVAVVDWIRHGGQELFELSLRGAARWYKVFILALTVFPQVSILDGSSSSLQLPVRVLVKSLVVQKRVKHHGVNITKSYQVANSARVFCIMIYFVGDTVLLDWR